MLQSDLEASSRRPASMILPLWATHLDRSASQPITPTRNLPSPLHPIKLTFSCRADMAGTQHLPARRSINSNLTPFPSPFLPPTIESHTLHAHQSLEVQLLCTSSTLLPSSSPCIGEPRPYHGSSLYQPHKPISSRLEFLLDPLKLQGSMASQKSS